MQSAPEGTYGPHTTRTANTLDPRVDSDMDGRAAAAAPTHQAPVAAGLNSTATTGAPTENTGERVARGIKGKIAQGHGVTESLRGNIMSGVDSLVGDKAKQPEHEAIAAAGDREVLDKEFVRKGTLHKSL
ncbi:hypothetical protein QBC39DRAFT_372302 [Podospora conica]|nr:hypothetical protein QBC39DRAFT_372302 [Schizothecium conicum]